MKHLITATLYILLTFVFAADLQAANEYTITATAGSGGSISPSGEVLANSGDSRTFTITPNTGYHVADVTVDGISQGAITSYTFNNVTANHTIQASFSSTIVFAVNSGGPQYTDSAGVTYLADTNYSGGYPGSTPATISGTTDGALYQSERFSNFSYTIPVANGNYSVTLKFAEIYFSSIGQRVFSVVINGQTVISNLDLYAKVGKNVAYDVVIPVSVTNGVVNINFISQVEKAKVSAIKITASAASSYAITESAGTGGIISPADTVTVNPGGSQTFTISPNAGYHVVDVRVDGVSKGAINSYTFSNVTANHTIQAIFYSSSNGNVFAVNSGGPQYTDSAGVTYLADTISSGGYPGYTTATISGTTDGTLYKSERYSNSSYTIPVANGNYSVTLKFAEFYLSAVGQRIFSVAINGQTVISNLDLYAKVGKNAAYDVVIPVYVTNGVININFINLVEKAKVSAIKIAASAASSYAITESAGTGGSISPADTVTVNPGDNQTFTITPNLGYHIVDVRVDGVSQGAINSYTFNNITANHTIQAIFYSSSNGNVFAVNSGGPQYTDSTGVTYLADNNYSGGQVGITTATISGTVDDTLYQAERNGSFSYNIPAANGNYSVTLKFAEIYWTAPGQRVFSVAINGQTVISNLDLCAVAGANTAYEVIIPVSVTSGAININFISVVNNPKVSAIKIAASDVIVPNVNGMTQQDGQAALVAAQLAIGTITTTYSNTISQGKIITQNPQAGTMTTPGALIDLVVSLGPAPQVLPPDPATVAPPPDPTVSTTVSAAAKFLYTGANPIQTGVVSGTIDVIRAAVLRGLVTERDGNPLSGVTVSILNHPEFGQTLSRADGMFDMAVNGGGLLTVTYEKSGYLPAHRQVNAPWQDYAWLPAVALIPVDAQVTTINLASPSQFQVHRESVVTDTYGTRQATLLFSPGTTAQMVMPDGSSQPVNSLSIRATEYTVGPNGPNAMPGQLPPASGYTYAVELSGDEAIAVGAKQVMFSQPVYLYVDNFIGFPVGQTVPTGYYDRTAGQWIASQNGRVINILSITGGLADIDTNGDGLADDAATLALLGITDAERQQLATLYPQTPKQLWRVPIPHLTPWDCNWPFGPPPDAVPPNQPVPEVHPTPDFCEREGSIIECQNQVLGERIGITGTPFTLNYRSSRVPGHLSDYTVNIPLSGASIPASLKRIVLIMEVAGRQSTHSFPAASNQSYTYTWDGKDAYGRTLQGKQHLKARIGYVYGLVYMEPNVFASSFGLLSNSGIPVTTNRGDFEVTLWQTEKLSIGGFDVRSVGLGGWDLDIHHVYDLGGKMLLLGDGSWRSADSLGGNIITTVAGQGSIRGFSGDGGPATSASFYGLNGLAVGPDGSFYIIDSFHGPSIRRIGPDGIITTVAGGEVGVGYGGDGGPATSAMLNYPQAVAVGPDGNIYIADTSNHRIRRVGPDGIITTVAGNGGNGYSGDGGPATSALLNFPNDVAVGSDGSIYIADTSNQRIRRVGPDGIITTVTGKISWFTFGGYSGDGGPAASALIEHPRGVAVGPDGSIYIADYGNNRIRRVGPNGIITTVAGNGIEGYGGDDGPATSASLNGPNGVAVGPDGSIYIPDWGNNRIRRVGTDGIIRTVVGDGNYADSHTITAPQATSTSITAPQNVAVGPDGTLYFEDLRGTVLRVKPAWLGISAAEIPIPSEDGSQIYIFIGSGKHLRTLNALTGATLFSFGYDPGSRIAAITDGAGNVTTIERDPNGKPTAIVAPFGQRTTLTLDPNGYLASVTNPAAEAYRMTYNDGGLMATYTDPKSNIHSFTYDASGLLIRDDKPDNPANGYTTLDGTSTPSSKYQVLTTALGRVSTYLTEYLSTGDERLTITMPSGAQSVTLSKTDGSRQIIMPDGTTSSTTLGIDPRFATLVHIPASTTVKTPSGLTRTTTLTRTAMLSNPNNLLSLISQTDTLNINSQVYTTTYNASSMTYTLTTPAGRSSSRTIDTLGRPVYLR